MTFYLSFDFLSHDWYLNFENDVNHNYRHKFIEKIIMIFHLIISTFDLIMT